MNDIIPVPPGFEIVFQDDYMTKYQGTINGHCVELGKVVVRGHRDWTCYIDDRLLFGGENDARAWSKLDTWVRRQK